MTAPFCDRNQHQQLAWQGFYGAKNRSCYTHTHCCDMTLMYRTAHSISTPKLSVSTYLVAFALWLNSGVKLELKKLTDLQRKK